MGEWREVTIADIAAPVRNALVGGPFGSNLVSRDYVENGVPVIRGQNMGNRWVSGDFVFVTEEKAESLSANLARPCDIVFTQRGTLGQVSLVPKAPFDEYIVSQSQMKLTVNQECANTLFFYYVFSSAEQQEYVQRNAIQTGVPHTNLGTLRSTPIPLPPLPEQRAIAHILSTLDDKIELNLRRNETLEAMARALFKSWFVDFDPVRAKAQGRNPGLPKELADLFPARLDNDGEPLGWHVEPLLDHARLISGGTPKTDNPAYWNGSIAWASAKDVSQCRDAFLVSTERSITERGLNESSTRVIPKFSTVVVARGATTGRFCMFGRDIAMNQTCYALATLRRRPFWLNCAFNNLVDALVHSAHGSVFDTITTKTIEGARVTVANDDLLDHFEAAVDPLFKRVLANIEGSRTLATLRDTLLPKLISGELRVKDAEKFVERVS